MSMMKNLKIFAAAAVILLISTVPSFANREVLSGYTQRLFNSDSGLGTNDALSVLQTRDGYVWISSYSGLIRYDSNEFVRFSKDTESGYTAVSATALHEDVHGKLWIGSNESGLFCRENDGSFRKVGGDDTSFSSVRSIVSDRNGIVYVGSSSGLGFVEGDRVKRVPIAELHTATILTLAAANDGSIWGITGKGDLFNIKEMKLRRFFTANSSSGPMSGLCIKKDGTILVGGGLGKVLAIKPNATSFKFDVMNTDGIGSINGLYEDAHGQVWACGDTGYGFFDEKNCFVYMEGSLISSSVEAIIEDYESNFWLVSTRQGLLQLTKNKFMDINFASQMQKSVVNAVIRYDGRLYVATDNGLVIIDSDWEMLSDGLTDLLENTRVRSIMADRKGNLWISSYGNLGLLCVSNNGSTRQTKSYTKEDGLPSGKIRTAYELSNGDIAVATTSGAAIIRNGKVIRTITEKDGLANSTILCICEDDTGALYVGTDGAGVYKIKGDRTDWISTSSGLDTGIILRMFYDKENKGIWVSTSNTISFIKNGLVKKINLSVPVSSGVFDFKKAKNGSLIVLSDMAVSIVDAASVAALIDGKKASAVSYSKKDGFKSTVTANSWSLLDKDCVLHICCSHGLYSIDLKNIHKNDVAPKLIINEAEIDGSVYINPTKLILPSSAQRLTLDVAVLSFTNPTYNSMKYKLEGFDAHNITALGKNQNKISYTNLSGGNYSFVLSAYNSDGLPSSGQIVLPVTKELRFFESGIVLFIVLALASILIFSITRFYYEKRNKALMLRQDELREITAQAMTAIANTIDAKDSYTRGHSTRVATYAVEIGKRLGYSRDKLDNLYYTALLHDIGKVGMPDEILNKPTALTDDEYEIMKRHSAVGGKILEVITVIDEIKNGAAYHHERYDGEGYNERLKGTEIPLVARIICVADAVDAMGSTRPYRTRRSRDFIISELEKNMGTQFDPVIARMFIELLKNGVINFERPDIY